jgi:hypothetical protein
LFSDELPAEPYLEVCVAALTKVLKKLEPPNAEAVIRAARTLRDRTYLKEVLSVVPQAQPIALLELLVEIVSEGGEDAQLAAAALTEVLKTRRARDFRPSILQAICRFQDADAAKALAMGALSQRIHEFEAELSGSRRHHGADGLRHILLTTPDLVSTAQLRLIVSAVGDETARDSLTSDLHKIASEELQRRGDEDPD